MVIRVMRESSRIRGIFISYCGGRISTQPSALEDKTYCPCIRAAHAEIASYFEAKDTLRNDLEKDYVASNRPGYVITETDGARALTTLRWGFPPPPAAKRPVVNVRNLTSPFWRTALSKPERRCLVPATSFSEWSAARNAAGKATLHWFNLPSRPLFALAGIWRPVDDGGAYAFLTCEPNSLVGAIHPKAMPVILAEDQFATWLNADFETICGLAQPFPSQLMPMV